MLKLFGTGKKKKSSSLTPGHLKIPIPMINGVQYANMTESQISTLIGGGNKGEPQMKKSVSSISSQRTNNTANTDRVPTAAQPTVYPTRSISSPPVLLMPKPVHSIPPTRFILRSHDYEKTQVENSEEESIDEESESEDDIIELFPSNPIRSGPIDFPTKNKESLIIEPIIEEREEEDSSVDATKLTNEGATVVTFESPKERNNKNHQSVNYVTRTSDDSNRQYLSASESPFFTASSVSNMNNNNFSNNQTTFSSSPLTSSPITQEIPLLKSIVSSDNHHQSFVSARSFNSDLNALSPSKSVQPSAPYNEEEPAPPNNDNNHNNNNTAQDHQDLLTVEESNTSNPTHQNKREKTPLRYNNNRAHSSSPMMNSKQPKVTRPASSSASSATIGHDVTLNTQSRFNNNTEKPPGNQITSELPGFATLHQNNNTKILQPLENITRIHSTAISNMEKQHSTLNNDLEELKRTVDRMQQQRVSDREEHLNRVKEQKLREKEILDQINITKQKLEMAIAGKLFAEDLHNTNDADNKAISASLSQGNDLEQLQQQHQQQQLQQQQQQQQQIQQQQQQQQQQIQQQQMQQQQQQRVEEPPVMKASTSTSSSKSRHKVNEPVRQSRQQPQQENRPRSRKSGSFISRQNEDPYMQSNIESYFPDVSNTDFEYMNNIHGIPPQHQFFPPISNKHRGPNGNMRGFYPDMDFMDGGNRYEPFDSPRTHMRPQRRQRSKSVESQWRAQQDPMEQQHFFQQQQQQRFPHQHGYDLVDPPVEDYHQTPPRTRSRKSSTHSARSNLSSAEGGPMSRNVSTHDLHSGYHSAAEDEEHAVEPTEEMMHMSANGNRLNDDGEQRSAQQYQPDEMRNNSGSRHRRRPPPPSNNNNMNGHLIPSMMYHDPAFGPPPAHMSHMGMMGDRERTKMRHPPYGYNNMPPPGSEYYPYIPQRVSPRMLAAEQQWNSPHHPQWGPAGNYGMLPPQGGPESNGGVTNGTNSGPNTPHHLQDNNQNNNGFNRRYPPQQQVGSMQQTPQQSQHGYLPIYADAPHRLYM